MNHTETALEVVADALMKEIKSYLDTVTNPLTSVLDKKSLWLKIFRVIGTYMEYNRFDDSGVMGGILLSIDQIMDSIKDLMAQEEKEQEVTETI
jgi:hypothetical protein